MIDNWDKSMTLLICTYCTQTGFQLINTSSAADWFQLYSLRTCSGKNNNKIRSPNFERDFHPEIMVPQKIYFIKNERELYSSQRSWNSIISYLHILQTEGPPFCQPQSPPTIKEKIGYTDAKSIGSSFSRLELHAQAGSGQIATIF